MSLSMSGARLLSIFSVLPETGWLSDSRRAWRAWRENAATAFGVSVARP